MHPPPNYDHTEMRAFFSLRKFYAPLPRASEKSERASYFFLLLSYVKKERTERAEFLLTSTCVTIPSFASSKTFGKFKEAARAKVGANF
jgi:hypothetical protein